MSLVLKLIGVGGITNQMLPELLQAFPKARYLLYDADIYKKRNLERQTFAQLGGNKALVTARALRERGFDAEGIPSYVTPDNSHLLIEDGDILLAGVDNHRTRKLLSDHCQELQKVVLISGGNELYDGSVQIFWRENGLSLTPPLDYCHPEIERPRDKGPFEKSCLDLWPSKPQLAETNLAIGRTMIEALGDVLAGKPVAEIYVDTKPTFITRKVLPQERGWIAA